MNKQPRRSRLLPQFSMATMISAMIVVSVLGAGIYYGNRAVDAGFRFEAIVVVLVVAAPAVLLLTMIVAQALLAWINRDRNDRR